MLYQWQGSRGISHAQSRLNKQAISECVPNRYGLFVGCIVPERLDGRAGKSGADVCIFDIFPHYSAALCLTERGMMGGGKKLFQSSLAGSMRSDEIAQSCESQRFVEYHPVFYPVAESFCAHFGVFAEPSNHIA